MIPFLNWAGGKRWLVNAHGTIFPTKYNTYIEPFLGSGAVFFYLCPDSAILSDINKDLIETYMAIKLNHSAVEKALKIHHNNHCKDYYYKIRATKPRTSHTRAARFLYLNRTCWNGLYRVNLKGDFNVPIGTKKNAVLNTDNFEMSSKLLQNVELRSSSFVNSIRSANKGDFIFADPPYTTSHNSNSFIKYNAPLFSWDDQIRLRDELAKAKYRGAKIVSTNANHKSVRSLYRDDFNFKPISRSSVIAADSRNRGRCSELLIIG